MWLLIMLFLRDVHSVMISNGNKDDELLANG